MKTNIFEGSTTQGYPRAFYENSINLNSLLEVIGHIGNKNGRDLEDIVVKYLIIEDSLLIAM